MPTSPILPSKILIISLDNIGDLVFASALVDPLKAAFAQASIGIWCKEYTSDVAGLIPGVDHVFTADPFWDTAPGRSAGSINNFLTALSRVRQENYDTVVVASTSWKAVATARAVAANRRIGFHSLGSRWWLTQEVSAQNEAQPILKELGRLLTLMGVPVEGLECRLEIKALESRRKSLRLKIGDGRLMALHPFAGDIKRCVPLQEWVHFADIWTAGVGGGTQLLWVGTPVELSVWRRVAGRKPNWLFIDELGDGTLAETVAAISLAESFVGHDSGLLHVANALGVPCVGIYAPGEPVRTQPQGWGTCQIISRPSPADVTSQNIVDAAMTLRDRVAQ